MSSPRSRINFEYPTEAHGRIPAFSSIEEEAEWWDTHDFTDYLDELEPVNVRFAKNLSAPISVRLDPVDRAEVIRRAKSKGIGPSTLIRMWIKDQLRRDPDSGSSST